jgi:hypothetical protein
MNNNRELRQALAYKGVYEALNDFAKWHRETFGLDGAHDPILRKAEAALKAAKEIIAP